MSCEFRQIGSITVDQYPITKLINRPVVIMHISARVVSDRDTMLMVHDIFLSEIRWGRIPDQSVVLMRTDLSKLYFDNRGYNSKEHFNANNSTSSKSINYLSMN